MHIDLFHDTVCPWCRIGKAHLKLALAQWTGEPVTITYHTYFLNANLPPEGTDFRAHMLAKGGGRIRLEDFFDAPRQMGAKVGLTFNFEAIQKAPNTLLSHRLIFLTEESQREAMIDALYAAYFEHGQDIGNLDVLVNIAAEFGLDGESIRARLLTDEQEAEVIADAEFGYQIGVQGVPFFILNEKLAFSGAQPPELILKALKQAASLTANS